MHAHPAPSPGSILPSSIASMMATVNTPGTDAILSSPEGILYRLPSCAQSSWDLGSGKVLRTSIIAPVFFHRKRDEFRESMECDARCRGCGNSVDGSSWTALVWKMFWEIDVRPSGDRPCSLEIAEPKTC
ncbi:hypothetical protein EV421DRAFT_1739732 [Armillaria borealis]|uniref:Uncharacterized protein n=1 Tax=Armillaria borealis TaxID=47425 RepID=A0AA39MJ52_9AGAR|nr:hypothetical protein EV421DRAFT_1739732 [Armillaria borealis]